MKMEKIDKVVLKETKYIAVVTVILSTLMQSVFLVIGKWTYMCLLGNILGAFAAVLNFFLMGITVQKAVVKEEKEAKNLMKFSQTSRLFMMLLFALVGYLIPVFNLLSVIIPYLFPRIAVMLRPFIVKEQG